MINSRSARFVMNDYNNTSSVTTMLDTLRWPSLATRRENQRLVLMYKIVRGLVAVPSDKLIPADGKTRSNQDHQFIDISLQEFLLSSYYSSLELSVTQSTATPWTRVQGSPLQITQHSTHSIGVISQLASLPITYLSRSRHTLRQNL